MALGKIFTVKSVRDTVLLWLREELQGDLEPNLVTNFANLAVMEQAEKISVANPDDYGQTVSVTDAASNVSTTIVTGIDYTNATKTVISVAHGLVSTDIGKRIILRTATRIGIFEIESITDVDNFVTTNAFGVDITDQSMEYTVLSHHASANIDISGLKIMNIVKLYSSVHKEVPKLGDVEADNIERNDFKNYKVYWYKHGETIYLIIPTDQVAGDLTLFYNRYPEIKTLDTDNFDIRDNYIPLVIERTKRMCLEHLGMKLPDAGIENRSESAKRDVTNRRAVIKLENEKGIDG